MTITRARKPTLPAPTSADEFIAAAPDAAPRAPKKGRKVQISLTVAPELLAAVDARAAEIGTSRAGLINMALHAAISRGLVIDGQRGE
jgi:hypothetical protein